MLAINTPFFPMHQGIFVAQLRIVRFFVRFLLFQAIFSLLEEK